MKKKLLYIIDDVNFVSGVQKVTACQIRHLQDSYDISIFSLVPAQENCRQSFAGVQVISLQETSLLQCVGLSFGQAMVSRYTFCQKLVKICASICCRFHMGSYLLRYLYKRELYHSFNSFNIICVASEASKLRDFVSMLPSPRKIQWIHTDYALWHCSSYWTKAVTKHDNRIYQRFDAIVCLSQRSQQGFTEKYPHLTDKTLVIRNLVDIEGIRKAVKFPTPFLVDDATFNIITVGRLDKEKAFDRILRICATLKEQHYLFHWYIVGGGVLEPEITREIGELQLGDTITLTGALENPYPLMAQCDLFALLSNYEGWPVTIDEALVLGLPVIATDVGGIGEQLCNGAFGTIVANEEQAIMLGLKRALSSGDRFRTADIERLREKNVDAVSMIYWCFGK